MLTGSFVQSIRPSSLLFLCNCQLLSFVNDNGCNNVVSRHIDIDVVC